MRVLMLGWDFSPRLSGGVGTACQGLAEALTRAPDSLGTEVVFVLPRLLGDEEPGKVRLLAGDRPAPSRAARPVATASVAAPRAQPERALVAAPPAGETAEPDPAPLPRAQAPTLPTPEEALKLLSIDSPLRPYLSPADYAGVVHELFARLRRQASAPSTARPRPKAAERAAPAAPVAPLPAPAWASRTGFDAGATVDIEVESEPAPASLDVARVPVPPYGRTLDLEVERYARAVLALAQDETFDVIHAHDWMTFPAGMLVAERTGKPLVVHFHSSEAERRGARALPEARALEQAAIDAAERVLCVSEASARALRSQYALEYAKLRVLHNAYSPLAERGPRTVNASPVVLYLGRLSEQKSPDVFLEAAAKVRARLPKTSFVLAGEGELYPELRALARELDLGRAVRFTGFVGGEDLARTYAGADVYVLSSASEPFGISALEALSLGVPTIVPRGAGVTEVVRSVLRFPEGDVDELADKIVALLERPALRAQLSAAGLREVKRLRWDRPARALRGVYDEITSR
jgi:glycogen synthase